MSGVKGFLPYKATAELMAASLSGYLFFDAIFLQLCHLSSAFESNNSAAVLFLHIHNSILTALRLL